MTMQVNSTESIANVSIIAIRKCFRHVLRSHWEDFTLSCLQDDLNLARRRAKALIKELEQQGYVQSVKQRSKTYFALTEKGMSLARASASGQVHRRTARSALHGVLKRVTELNARPDALDDIAAVVVFGSYLSDSPKLGDLDIAVMLRDRYQHDDQWCRRREDYAAKSGRRFSTFVERMAWHELEIYKLLKAGKRTINIQDWHSFRKMAKHSSFKYEVVFGDPEEVKVNVEKEQ